jgi:hypothetical protein
LPTGPAKLPSTWVRRSWLLMGSLHAFSCDTLVFFHSMAAAALFCRICSADAPETGNAC